MASQIIGAGYVLYALFNIGMTGLLFSLALGLIVLGMQDSFELAVAAAILTGILYQMIPFRRREGFMTKPVASSNGNAKMMEKLANGEVAKTLEEGYQTWSPADVVDRLAGMRAAKKLNTPPVGYDGRYAAGVTGGPVGVLASDFAEGFANPNADTDATGTNESSSGSGSQNSPSSTPAAASETGKDATPPPPAAAAKKTTSGFAGSSDGLFKLGEIPSDIGGGSYIDAGSTILSAIQNLKPDQLQNMTDDTRKLLDTQKSLLGMLETMKPMIQDGSQLLQSFNTMFGKNGQ
jgi:hypothetical protein